MSTSAPPPGQRGIGEPAARAPIGVHAVAVRAHDAAELAGRDRVAHRDHGLVVPPRVQHEQQPVVTAAASSIASPSATVVAIGFSQSTCLPASSAAIDCRRAARSGVQTTTASTSGALTSARQSVVTRSMPCSAAKRSADSSRWLATPATVSAARRGGACVHVGDPAAAEHREPCRHAPAPIGSFSMIAAACAWMRAAASATRSTRSRSASRMRCSIQTVEAAACSATGRWRFA